MSTHYSEVNENTMAYSLAGHRHLPEITQELALLTDQALEITFLTHLVPMTRGILSSCYSRLKQGHTLMNTGTISDVKEAYKEFYKDHPFVVITDTPPQTKQTLGNNQCLIHPTIDLRTNRLIVISCIDNLVKGAAGQAVQNMNLMYQLPEETALESLAVYP
jgi:N-acetyl-gamma-glutamyl-phosphate reductase